MGGHECSRNNGIHDLEDENTKVNINGLGKNLFSEVEIKIRRKFTNNDEWDKK